MNERPNNSPLSPVERLANVYDSLADDVFDTAIEIDEETNQRATRVVRDATAQALGTMPEKSAPSNVLPSEGASDKSGKTAEDYDWSRRPSPKPLPKTSSLDLPTIGDAVARGVTKALGRIADLFRSKVNK